MSENILERLSQLEPDWADVELRSRSLRQQHLRRKVLLITGAIAAAAVLAGGAYAAARAIWSGHDMTPADIARQATVVTNDKWSVCDGHGSCTTKTASHQEIDILPSMGVVFVLPGADGHPDYALSLVPGGAAVEVPPSGWGSMSPLLDSSGHGIGGVWILQRPDGSKYEVTWYSATGSVTERITDAAGRTTTVPLRAGDVVPLIPGSTDGHSRTLDKAVTFDLPSADRVIIFPQLNETYIDGVNAPPDAEPLPYDSAAKYGLTPLGHYNGKLPVTVSGGSWTVHLDGLTSTVSWTKGDSFVTVQDTSPSGTTTTRVPIGHELPLVPFK
jgi:hypothetical protein